MTIIAVIATSVRRATGLESQRGRGIESAVMGALSPRPARWPSCRTLARAPGDDREDPRPVDDPDKLAILDDAQRRLALGGRTDRVADHRIGRELGTRSARAPRRSARA